jgi:drug/metabolite transporter (DMT)-like permease
MAYQLSVDAVGVPSTVALLYLAPALVVAGSGPLLSEWPSALRVGLAVLVTVGVWLSVLGADDVETSFGAAGAGWGILAAFCYAGYLMLGRHASPRWGSVPTMVYSMVAACILLTVVVPMRPGPLVAPPDARAWTLLAVFGLLTIAIAQFLFFDALGRIEASGVAVSSTAEPVVGSLLATTLLSQGLDPLGWLGVTLVVLGVAGVGVTLPRADTA